MIFNRDSIERKKHRQLREENQLYGYTFKSDYNLHPHQIIYRLEPRKREGKLDGNCENCMCLLTTYFNHHVTNLLAH